MADVHDLVTSPPRFTTLAALSALLVAGCGKTDSGGSFVRRDPRAGPLVPQADLGADTRLPVVTPRWGPPTWRADGFVPVPQVYGHPPLDDR